MDGIHVFLVGNTLFAESVVLMLQASEAFGTVEWFKTLAVAIPLIQYSSPDILVLADVKTATLDDGAPFYPEIPVICTDSDSTYMKLITTKHINASLTDLIETITTASKISTKTKMEES